MAGPRPGPARRVCRSRDRAGTRTWRPLLGWRYLAGPAGPRADLQSLVARPHAGYSARRFGDTEGDDGRHLDQPRGAADQPRGLADRSGAVAWDRAGAAGRPRAAAAVAAALGDRRRLRRLARCQRPVRAGLAHRLADREAVAQQADRNSQRLAGPRPPAAR